jgi:hypothetical protein
MQHFIREGRENLVCPTFGSKDYDNHIYTSTLHVDTIPLKPKLIYTILKVSVPTTKKTQHSTIMNISQLMLFQEITAIYSKNHMESINTLQVK